jgi:cytochrome c-type biogenesis protein CcmH
MRRLARSLAALAAVAMLAAAADPADRLPNPAQEARARALFGQIRCVVCQSESIDDSEADLARDLRQTVRAQVAAGRSDAEIRRFLVQRYGEFILLRPVFSPANALAWLGPFVIVLAGGTFLLLRARRRPPPQDDELTPEEEARLARIEDRGA